MSHRHLFRDPLPAGVAAALLAGAGTLLAAASGEPLWPAPAALSMERLLETLPFATGVAAIAGLVTGGIVGWSLWPQAEVEEIRRKLEEVVAHRTEELRRSDQKYRNLVGQSRDGILLWEPHTLQILEINARGAELLGMRPRDLVSRPFHGFFAPSQRASALRTLRGVSRTGSAILDDVELVQEGGTLFHAEVEASIVRFPDGNAILGIVRDLSPSKSLERQAALVSQQMIEAEKMASIGLLASGVAHEINNPMGYVTSNVNRLTEYARRLGDLLRKSAALEGEDRTEINELLGELEEIACETHEGIERVSEIVEALREFAHGGTGGPGREWVDLNRVIRNCLTLCHNRLKDRAAVELELETLPQVRCHPTQIAQVLMNLLRNAADAVQPGGHIRVFSYDSGDRVQIAVEDDGPGIEREHLARIFEPFFTTKPVGAGSGLGLSVSREIARRHGGELSVDSLAGRGTRFLLELPREEPPPV